MPVACSPFQLDELQSLKMPLVACICGAICENVCTKMDNDKVYESNTISSPEI